MNNVAVRCTTSTAVQPPVSRRMRNWLCTNAAMLVRTTHYCRSTYTKLTMYSGLLWPGLQYRRHTVQYKTVLVMCSI